MPEARPPAELGERGALRAGDVVRAPFLDGQRYLATVEEDRGDGTYTLAWLDGDDADRIKAAADLQLMSYDAELKCYTERPRLAEPDAAPAGHREPCTSAAKPQAAAPGASASTAAEGSRIEVLVRHPFQAGEVSVVLPRHAKFKHVKTALARVLGSNGIIHRGELMRREHGKYRGYKDAAYVGDVREVLTTSADFLVEGDEGRLAVSLEDGEVSMDDEYIELHRVRSTGSDSTPTEKPLGRGARVELVAGPHAGDSGKVLELLGASGMMQVRLANSGLVHVVRAADCRRVKKRAAQLEEPSEICAHLLKCGAEAEETYTAALEAMQLQPGAAEAEIARQYRRWSMRIHPDKCSLPDASAAFQVLVRSHNRLRGRLSGGGEGSAAAAAADASVSRVEDGLTLRSALALLRDLREGFTGQSFQAKLETLEFQRDCYSTTAQYMRDRNELFASVHSVVLPRHGFEGTQSGIYKMLSQMAAFAENEEFRSTAAELNELLGVDLLPDRWGRVAKACKRHTDAESRAHLAAQRGGYCGLLLGGASASRPGGGLLALARNAGAGASGPEAQQAPTEPEGPRPWPAEKRPPFRLFIAGSWNEYSPQVMRWESGLFLHQVVVTEQGSERFHLLKNGSEEGAFYPDREDASPFEGFDILGPNDEGYGLNWHIGKFPEEQLKHRSRVVVVAALDDKGALRSVDWQQGQLKPAAPATAPSSPQKQAPTYAVRGAATPDECLLPWEVGEERPAWEAELDGIGA